MFQFLEESSFDQGSTSNQLESNSCCSDFRVHQIMSSFLIFMQDVQGKCLRTKLNKVPQSINRVIAWPPALSTSGDSCYWVAMAAPEGVPHGYSPCVEATEDKAAHGTRPAPGLLRDAIASSVCVECYLITCVEILGSQSLPVYGSGGGTLL